jgi:protoheme IX farnesyltransferase
MVVGTQRTEPAVVPTASSAQADARVPAGRGATTVSTVLRRLTAYVALTKPRIIELLLVTTLPTMLLAQQRVGGGFPSIGLLAATLVGGTVAAGSANTLNMYLDRDIDALMNRTRRRPLVTGEVTPRAALVFGIVLGVVSVVFFWVVVNLASALLTAAAILLYVVGYTMLLKRRTPQNIVWGGIAGCMPVFIGWSAVTGSLDWAPVALFLVVFFWTPPHYWPLSMKFRKDYAVAGVPMLPVVASDVRVSVEMVAYSVAMVGASLALVPLAPMTWVYTVVAAVAGAWFLASVVVLLRRARHPIPGRKLGEMAVFHGSITYLTVLFAAVAVDPFWPV